MKAACNCSLSCAHNQAPFISHPASCSHCFAIHWSLLGGSQIPAMPFDKGENGQPCTRNTVWYLMWESSLWLRPQQLFSTSNSSHSFGLLVWSSWELKSETTAQSLREARCSFTVRVYTEMNRNVRSRKHCNRTSASPFLTLLDTEKAIFY